jgi:uncharacterized protein with HEPN domain
MMRFMPSENDIAPLQDILRHIEPAERFGREREVGHDDLLPLYAVTRCLEIISEASRRLSAALKARHTHIPWPQMAAAGNFYRHDYEDVLPQRVWKTLAQDIPKLRAVVEQELAGNSEAPG